jgi:alkanesulfonate monooxygenase SsuD/methylene tetrahydromethanopterin reductase-like flavin-dependent oxidoreductase (luciferase family)
MRDPGNRLKLAVFCANVARGTSMSDAESLPKVTWPESRRLALAADRAGIDGMIPLGRWKATARGAPEVDRTFEPWTWASALSAITERVSVFTTVNMQQFHPLVAALMASTIDHVSGGRLELGLGAGGPDLGHDQYALPFPPVGVRLEMLDEACHVLRALWTQESTSFEGRHFTLRDAHLEPKPVQERLPLVIGGAGERRMLRIVAEHADVWNTFGGDVDLVRRQLAVLARHCAEVGRDAGDIRTSLLYRAVVGETEREARSRLDELVPASSPARTATFAGTPEQLVDHLRPYVELGVGDFLLGVRAPVDWPTVELVAGAVAPVLRGA